MSNLAFESDAIPVVADSTARGVRFPAPLENQRVQNLATGCIERWTSGAWTQERLVLPSLTAAQRDALTGVLEGTVVFNDDTNKLNFYTGAGWEAVTSA